MGRGAGLSEKVILMLRYDHQEGNSYVEVGDEDLGLSLLFCIPSCSHLPPISRKCGELTFPMVNLII